MEGDEMTDAEIDALRGKAMRESVAAGENFTRFRFARLVAERAAQKEREANIKACDRLTEAWARKYGTAMGQMVGLGEGTATDCMNAIRQRGAK